MTANATATGQNGLLVQGLVGSGHALSHFYLLALPPLFPLIQAEMGTSYTQLGFLLTTIAIATGCLQIGAGSLVDRYGARRMLLLGLATMALGAVAVGVAPAYWAMVVGAALIGAGDSVIHPADYVILNASIARSRLGRAFGMHTFNGNIGFALAPPAMLALAAGFGWRGAMLVAGALALAVMALVMAYGSVLQESPGQRDGAAPPTVPVPGWRAMMTAPILLMFAFYAIGAMGSIGLNGFLVSALVEAHAVAIGTANAVFTGYLVAGAAGVLLGGLIADATSRHGPVVATALLGSACLAALGAWAPLPAAALFAIFAGVGLLQGVTRPSRDIITREIAPPGAIGRTFAFVSTGLSVGGALAPTALGWMLDHGRPETVFIVVGGIFALAVFTVGLTRGARRRAAHASAD